MTEIEMNKRIVLAAFLSQFLLSAMLGMHFSRLATANPVPYGVIWMPEEYINATISLIDGVLWARVNGTYPFEYPYFPLPYDSLAMDYPVPSDAYNISVKMNETSLDWSYRDKNYSTVIGDFPMINWTICPVPFPVNFAIDTHYEHPVPLIGGKYTFLYAMGTGRYLQYYAKQTTAYVTVSISKYAAYTEELIKVYTIGYNAATKEWIWTPANYNITQADETWIVTLTKVSGEFYPLVEDLLITIEKPYGLCDIGITNVTTSQSVVCQGSNLDVDVEIVNYGLNTETFKVTACANTAVIDTQVVSLCGNASTILSFAWNMSGVDKGDYTISAKASAVLGETHLEDNRKIGGKVTVVRLGHDVAIQDVTFKTAVGQGCPLYIRMTARNYGSFIEKFNVTVYCNNTNFNATIPITLTSGNSTAINLTWNTTGIAKGNYPIRIYADSVPGETDITDNTYPDGWVVVTIMGDVDGDFDCGADDVFMYVSPAYGTRGPPKKNPADPKYNLNCDFDEDGDVDADDVFTYFAPNYGKSC